MVSAAKIKANSVGQGEDGTWGMTCPLTDGSCGDRATMTPFTSTGWPTKAIATDRLEQHLDEHRGKGIAMSLEDFRAKHNLEPGEDAKTARVRIEDLA